MWFRGTSKQEGSQTQARHEKVVRKKKKKNWTRDRARYRKHSKLPFGVLSFRRMSFDCMNYIWWLYKYGTASMFTLYSRIASICVYWQTEVFDVVYVSGPNFPSVQMMRLGILFNNFHNVQALLLAIFTSLFFSGIFSNSCGSSIDYLPSRISNSHIIRNRAAAATKLLVDGCHVWKRLPERWRIWSKWSK